MGLLTYILLFGHLLPCVRTINMTFFPCDVSANGVDCSKRPLTRVPTFASTTVTTLNLSNTKIKKLEEDSFKGLPNLHTLKIDDLCHPQKAAISVCKLEIDHGTFKTLRKLESLSLNGNSLAFIPWLPESLKTLHLQLNRLFQIDNWKAPNLEVLDLSRNCYKENPCYQSFFIDESVFKTMPKLTSLTLGYNNLTTVPKGFPPSLKYLDLRENTITEIPNNAFINLTLLKHLNLEWNCQRCDHAVRPCIPCPNNTALQLHPKSLFSENSSIEYLSLRGNSLKKFPKGLFAPLKNLKTLDLSDNMLAPAIQNETFFSELKSVEWLNLIYNYEPKVTYTELNLSPHFAEISNLRSLHLSGYFFRQLSNKSFNILSNLHNLKELDLTMNFIDSWDAAALRMLPSVTSVDISQNMLTFVSSCDKQHCARPAFSQNQSSAQVDTEVLTLDDPVQTESQNTSECGTKFRTLAELRRSCCNHKMKFNISANDILYLNPNVFEGMARAVCLDLSFNYMSQALKGGEFSNLHKLVFLNMSYNRLDLYYNKAFNELNNTLKVLDLSNNEFHFNLKGIGHDLDFIQNLDKLLVLNLANNKIGMRITRNLSSSSLNYLYFNGNHLDYMWESDNNNYNHFFQNLSNLTFLDISDNNLIVITDGILCNFPKTLTLLIISNNKITYFPWRSLSVLHRLEHLDISYNNIDFLPSTVEFGASFLYLDVSHNHIATIPDPLFSKLKSLQSLFLDNNQIKVFNQASLEQSFNNGSNLRQLGLHNNPFICDCETAWFADFLSGTLIHIPHLTTSVQCGFPESQQGMSVLHQSEHSSCQEKYGSLAFVICAFLTVMLTALPLLNHLYSWDLWYCFQVLWARSKGYSRLHGSDSKYQYDAFVLFDTNNAAVRDWVYNELICHLEDKGQRRFCLCLEERDWIPGLSCFENLHNAVYKSVKTVFVLTRGREVADGVIRQAFFMVQQRLLDEKEDTAVLVLLDDMFTNPRYLQLRKRLCRRSVLSWPKNPNAHPFFWNQMRTALSSNNLKFYDKNMKKCAEEALGKTLDMLNGAGGGVCGLRSLGPPTPDEED